MVLSEWKISRAQGLRNTSSCSYAKLLLSCGSLKDVKSLHAAIVERKLDRDMYLVLRETPSMDVVLWTRVIGAYNQQNVHEKAFKVYRYMLLQGVEPDVVAFIPVLEACAALGILKEGLQLEACIFEAGLEISSALGNSMVRMYGKCGSLLDAQRVFDEMKDKDVISWTSLSTAYGQNGDPDKALALFHQMQLEGVRPSRISFVAVLNSSESSIAVEEARKLHECIKESGCELELIVGNALVNMFAKCGRPDDACQVFDLMPERDVVTWTALVSAYALEKNTKQTSQVVQRMVLHGVRPNHVTFVTALNTCEKPSSLTFGKKMHALAVEGGYESEIIVGNASVNMFGKCGSLEEAHAVFNRMPDRDVITWNAIISAYAHRVHDKEPLLLFEEMQAENVSPNKVTYVTLLYACARLKALGEGRAIHARVDEAGLSFEVIVGTALVNLYAKCGQLEEARSIFDNMRREDVIAWNAIIGPYAESGMISEAMELLDKMECEGIAADEVTYISVLNSLGSSEWLEHGKVLHRTMTKRRLSSRTAAATALLNMYVRCGSMDDAEKVFEAMENHDVLSWTSMVLGYYEACRHKEALAVYRRMQQCGVLPDKAAVMIVFKVCSSLELIVQGKMIHASLRGSDLEQDTEVGNAAITMYGKCHCTEAARATFDSMERPDAASWAGILKTYSQHEEHDRVMELFEQAEKLQGSDLVHTRSGYVSIIRACGNAGAIATGRRIHRQIEEGRAKLCGIIGSTLLDMYGKCGSLEEARSVFDSLRSCRDLVLWTSMMVAYEQNGQGWKSLEIFRLLQQEGVVPDEVVFVAALSACTSLGLSDEALEFLACMRTDYDLEASKQHLGCLVDSLGRTGRLAEAEEVMVERGDDPVMWMSVLGGCSVHQDVERARRALGKMFVGCDQKSAALVLLSNLHKASTLARERNCYFKY